MKQSMRLSVVFLLTVPLRGERASPQTSQSGAGLNMLQLKNQVDRIRDAELKSSNLGQVFDEAGSEKMLSMAENMLADLGSAPFLDDPEVEKVLNETIAAISDHMYVSMTNEHDANQDTINDDKAAVVQCETTATHELSSTVGGLESTTGSARQAHKDCRDVQDVLIGYEERNETALQNIVATRQNSLSTCPACCPAYPTKGDEAGYQTFVDSDPFTALKQAFDSLKDDFTDTLDKRDTSVDNHDLKETECNGLQGDFESEYCQWRTENVDTCDDYATCWNTETAEYNSTAAQLKAPVAARKLAYERGEQIIHQIRCLLEHTTCSDTTPPPVSTAKWDITYPGLPSKYACSTTKTDVPPCESDFIKVEYTDVFTKSMPTQCSSSGCP